MKSAKRPSQLMEDEDSDRPLDIPLAKQSFQPCPQQMICGYFLKPSHLQRNCWKAYELSFMCGFGDHMKSKCSFKKTKNTASIQPTHPVPPLGENPGPTDRRTSLHP